MKKDIWIIVYTKEQGKLELTLEEWMNRTGNETLHREDGPAREYSRGERHWYLNGKRHRIDGPAIEYDDGKMSWYIDGDYYIASQYNQIIQEAKSIPLELRLTDPRWWVRELK